jgi:hypothetical protein
MKICSFCDTCDDNESWFNTYQLCDDCKKIKDISRIYSMESIVHVIEQIFVKEKKPIDSRTQAISKECPLKLHKKKVDKKNLSI